MKKGNKRAIIFGPWVGEFTYEVSWWVPEARQVRNEKFLGYRSFALGYIGRRGLYKDFIDEYIEHPRFLQNTLKYPSMTYTVENGIHVIPQNMLEYLRLFVDYLRREGYEEVQYMLPGPLELRPDPRTGSVLIPQKAFADFPRGEYKHLDPDPEIEKIVKRKLKQFKNKQDFVYIMASVRHRNGQLEAKNWPPEKYVEFIIKLIKKLKINIVLAGPQGRGDYPGALSLATNKDLQKYKDNILDLVFDEDIVDYQLAILKNTKCSFWNSTGACTLAFFTNTPMFTQQAKEYGWRHELPWQKELTGGHKHIKVFDKYPASEVQASPVDELVEEFTSFYKKL